MNRISVRVKQLLSDSYARTSRAVVWYRQRSLADFTFLTVLPILAASVLVFMVMAETKNPTSLMSVEVDGAKAGEANALTAEPIDTHHFTNSSQVPDLNEAENSTANSWNYEEAAESLERVNNESVNIKSFTTHELTPGEKSTILYFDGRPVRPVRTMTMTVTAYSPDARSCAPFDDGITASGYSVWTNGMKLIAADKKLPFGTLLSVPGYNGSRPTPVLDRGSAIKGNRLDLLFPTHDIARQWGRQKLTVTVWEYAD